MFAVPDSAARPLALALSPILLAQGRAMKRRMPLLPEAAGARTGAFGSADGSPLSLLIFGESTAAGVGVDSNDEGMAGAIARRLAVTGRPVNWSVTARTGYTAAAARAKLLKHVHGEFDLIVVLLGVNDALGLTPRDDWARDVRAVLDGLRPHLRPEGRILCAGVPQMSQFQALPQPSRMAIGAHARSLDHRLARCVTNAAGVSYVTSPLPVGPGVLAADGFHPSALGYEQWADQLAETTGLLAASATDSSERSA